MGNILQKCWTGYYYIFKKLYFNSLGKHCRFEGRMILRGRGKLDMGDNVQICQNAIFIIAEKSKLIIHDRVFIGNGVKISCHEFVEIGEDTILAEYVCIHDNDHVFEKLDKPINRQGFTTSAVRIGKDCWIASHCIIVRSGGLEDRCILGAGSVLSRQLPANSIATGVPAKIIRTRNVMS